MAESIPTTLDTLLRRGKTALVVYDMQVGIVDQVSHGAEVIEKVYRVLHAARKAQIPIFFTKHISLPVNLMGGFQLRQAMAWQQKSEVRDVRSPFLSDAPGTQIIEQLKPLPSEAIVEKITMSAFEGTFLSIAMRDLGVDSFIIAGIALEIGIEPTVRHAADLALVPIVITDACGCGDHDAARQATELIRYMGDAILANAEEIVEVLSA